LQQQLAIEVRRLSQKLVTAARGTSSRSIRSSEAGIARPVVDLDPRYAGVP
jgi:hypothetical protein